MLKDATLYSVLPAKDCDRLRMYLSEKLGLGPVNEMAGMLIYELGGSKLLVYESAFAGTNQATAVSMKVADLEIVVDDLKSKGVVFEHYDMPGTTVMGDIHARAVMPGKSVWFKDTEGNIININQST